MSNSLRDRLNLARSLASTLVRTGAGITSVPESIQPVQILRLYDIENCPYCRLVREALTELDLDVEIYPCPKQGGIYRNQVAELGGKHQFPFLVDLNTNTMMYESMEIIGYLFKTYSRTPLPLKWQFNTLQTLGSTIAGVSRLGAGLVKCESRPPEQLLELYSFESSPFARLVRECLCEMEIPYIVRNCGRSELSEWLVPGVRDWLGTHPKSKLRNRVKLQKLTGRVAIPYLFDPNTQFGLYESADIIAYLKENYTR